MEDCQAYALGVGVEAEATSRRGWTVHALNPLDWCITGQIRGQQVFQ